MRSMRPDPEIRVQKITIPAGRRRIPALVLSPKDVPGGRPGEKVRGGGGVAGIPAGLGRALSGGAGRLLCGAAVHEVPRRRAGHSGRPARGGRGAVLCRDGAVYREPEEMRDSRQCGRVPPRCARL